MYSAHDSSRAPQSSDHKGGKVENNLRLHVRSLVLKHGFIPIALIVMCPALGCKRTESSNQRLRDPGLEAKAVQTVPEMQHRIASNDQTYRVSFTSKPSPIPMNEPFTLDVVVQHEGNGDAENLNLAVDAAMPDHQHGMNTQPRVLKRGGGRFTVEGMLFHMPGHWELYFDITDAAVAERAQFDVNLE